MNTIKELLERVYANDYEMTIVKTKGERSMVRLDLKKDLPNGYRIGRTLEITPEFLVGADMKYVGYTVSEMFDKMLQEEKLKTTYDTTNT